MLAARDHLVGRLTGPTVLVCGIVNVTPDSRVSPQLM
jgi:hypothetical protein